jgi:hypothetical protein
MLRTRIQRESQRDTFNCKTSCVLNGFMRIIIENRVVKRRVAFFCPGLWIKGE